MKNLKRAVLLTLAPLMLALAPGQSVPDLSGKNQDGKTVRLADHKGKYVLLYFYPKDGTPGCTREATEFSRLHPDYKKAGAEVFGVSRQDESSHQAFRKDQNIPFDLLADTDGSLAKALGVGSLPVIGLTKRQSVLIGPDGKVAKFYPDVDPASHAQDVLADIKKLKK